MPNTTNTSSADTRTSRPRGAGRTRTMRGRASYRTGSFEVFAYPHHSMPAVVFGAVWRWRIELFLLITAAGGLDRAGLPTPRDVAHLEPTGGAGHHDHRYRCGAAVSPVRVSPRLVRVFAASGPEMLRPVPGDDPRGTAAAVHVDPTHPGRGTPVAVATPRPVRPRHRQCRPIASPRRVGRRVPG